MIFLDTCYVPREPEPSARWIWLLITVTAMVAPWMLALMFVVHAPAAIFLALLFAAFAAVVLAAVMADR